MALAVVASIGVTSTAFMGEAARASFAGDGGLLTASTGDKSIQRLGGTPLVTAQAVGHASWSPDGSRAVYVTPDNHISTVRFNDGGNVVPVTTPGSAQQPERSSPSWANSGREVVFAEKSGTGKTWRLMRASVGSSGAPVPVGGVDDVFGFHEFNPDAGSSVFVYESRVDDGFGNPIGGSEIFQSPRHKIISGGANPAISPDQKMLAFVRSINDFNQIFVCGMSDCLGSIEQLTGGATNKDEPTWSPDGQTIAFLDKGDGKVHVENVSDVQGAPATDLVGVPSYQPNNRDFVVRLSGLNRFETAIAISKSVFSPGTKSVVLSRSDLFADALGGSALAAAKRGPLLLTPPTSLNAATKAEIQRVLGADQTATVYLLGGTGAISASVEDSVKAMGYQVKRLSGNDRFQTAIAIANEIDTSPDHILVATGRNFPDALAAGAAAGSINTIRTGSAVVVLSNDTALPATVGDYLKTNATAKVYGIGGQGKTAAESLLGASAVVDVVGSNRYETARVTALTFFGNGPTGIVPVFAGLATGTNWPDALAGGALMGFLVGPLLLTPSSSDNLAQPTSAYLDATSAGIFAVTIFGGSGAVNTAINTKAGNAISGPAGFELLTTLAPLG